MTGRASALFACALWIAGIAGIAGAGEQSAVYRASGADARLFDQYDNDGYSMAVVAVEGAVELRVRVSDAPLESAAPFPTGLRRETALPPAPDRDAFAARLSQGSRTSAEAVRRVLLGIVSEIRYDPDRLRNQDPSAVFASKRAYCVGFSELAVDLLRRLSIPARTVQGVLRADPGADRYDPKIEGVYHRWIEVFYPDRGFVFSDPAGSVNGVDARYLPFDRRSLRRPRALQLEGLEPPAGALAYETVRAGKVTMRLRN
ncbi:MAG: transglutaminase-like domain-containing protein [Acidobacteriota bacterium]